MTEILERLGLFLRLPDMRPRAEIEADIRDELAAHVALRAHENEAAGMSPGEALRDAEERFGDTQRVFAECREVQMKERVMLQRINVVLIVVLIAGMATNLWVGAAARAGMEHELGQLRGDLHALTGVMREVPRTLPVAAQPDVSADVAALRGDVAMLANQLLAPTEKEWERAGRAYAESASVATTPSARVSVLGKVGTPGEFEWREGLTLTKLIAMAGDFEEFANRSKVSIIRDTEKGRQIIEVDFDDILTGKRIDVTIQPDDLVSVPESFF